MIKWLSRLIFGAEPKSSYACGRDYALGELNKFGMAAKERLYAESLGSFNCTVGEAEFDQGIRDAIRDFNAQQREIVRNMLK
jgi:hypothetical protein